MTRDEIVTALRCCAEGECLCILHGKNRTGMHRLQKMGR